MDGRGGGRGFRAGDEKERAWLKNTQYPFGPFDSFAESSLHMYGRG